MLRFEIVPLPIGQYVVLALHEKTFNVDYIDLDGKIQTCPVAKIEKEMMKKFGYTDALAMAYKLNYPKEN